MDHCILQGPDPKLILNRSCVAVTIVGSLCLFLRPFPLQHDSNKHQILPKEIVGWRSKEFSNVNLGVFPFFIGEPRAQYERVAKWPNILNTIYVCVFSS